MNKPPEERAKDVTTVSSAEHTRRDFLYIATGAVGAVGAAAVLVPLIAQMNPDASTIAAGAPIEVDLAPVTEGQVIKVFWRSKPIFIGHRSKKEIDDFYKMLDQLENVFKTPAAPDEDLETKKARLAAELASLNSNIVPGEVVPSATDD